MRVAYVSSCLTRSAGGLYYSVSGLAGEVARQGVGVTVFGGADGYFEDDRRQWGGVELQPYPQSDVYSFEWSVFRQLLRHRPDVLHVHGIWTATSIYGRFAQLAGIPVVVSPHGMLEGWILGRRRLVKAVHGALFERPLVRGAHVHALCAAEYESIRRYEPSATKRMFVVPNGTSPVELPGYQTERSGVLYLGRLHPKKQVLELAKAWAVSPVMAPYTLTIAGWGDAAYEASIRAIAEASGNVRFVGALHGAEKARAFETARAFILPSLSEGLPMSVLEALQHGCLPVITEQCNLPELFADGAALRIAADLSDLDQVVVGAMAQPNEDLRVRSSFLAAYARRYRWSEIARSMIGHYEEMLEQPGAMPVRST